MNRSLISLLLPEYRRLILGLLLLHPRTALHGREIARRTALSPGTVTRELGKLADVGLLLRQTQGNQRVYRANTDCPVYEELASILRKTSGIADVLLAGLAPLTVNIQVAFIFGSVAQGKETQGSDIDVLIIGHLEFNDVIQALWPLQAELGREINPKIFTVDQFRQQCNEPFLRDVLAKPKIFLTGSDHDLEELIGRQS